MPSPVQFAMRASHTKLYYTPSKIPSPLGVSMRGKSPRRSLQALQWKEEQCEACELRRKNQALQSSKQRVRGKLSEAVRRHEQLAGEHQAILSQSQQLKAQNVSLVDQALALTSQINTEKVKTEQQLRLVKIKSKRCSELEQHQQYLEQQIQHLQHGLQNSQQQSAVLRTELQHRCDQVNDLTRDHNALLTKFRELTVLMSEAHNKLNTAVAQSGKAMAKDHSKTVLRTWSHSSIASTLRTIKHKMPFSKEASRPAGNCPALQENAPPQHAGHQKAPHTPIASRLRPANQHIRSFSPLNPHTTPPPSMPPPCMQHQTPAGPGLSNPEAAAGSSPDVRPAFEYTSKKDLKKATKVLLQRVADRDIPGGVSGSGWGPPTGGNSPFGAFSGLSRNARPNFFAHTPCKPDWWPLKEWHDGQFLERADSGAIAAVHDAALVQILAR